MSELLVVYDLLRRTHATVKKKAGDGDGSSLDVVDLSPLLLFDPNNAFLLHPEQKKPCSTTHNSVLRSTVSFLATYVSTVGYNMWSDIPYVVVL